MFARQWQYLINYRSMTQVSTVTQPKQEQLTRGDNIILNARPVSLVSFLEMLAINTPEYTAIIRMPHYTHRQNRYYAERGRSE